MPEKDTLQPSKKWSIKFREKKITDSWKTCDEIVISEGGIGNRKGCDNQDWVGDGYCDDIVNNPECNYDDGDCCGDDANVQYCIECKCFNEG